MLFLATLFGCCLGFHPVLFKLITETSFSNPQTKQTKPTTSQGKCILTYYNHNQISKNFRNCFWEGQVLAVMLQCMYMYPSMFWWVSWLLHMYTGGIWKGLRCCSHTFIPMVTTPPVVNFVLCTITIIITITTKTKTVCCLYPKISSGLEKLTTTKLKA